MNQVVSSRALLAAEALARPRPEGEPRPYRWTSGQLLQVSELGLFGDRRVELIEGELFEMPDEGELHQSLRELILNDLIEWLAQQHRRAFIVGSNGPIRLDDESEPEPNIYIRPRAMPVSQVGGADSLLVIEVASTSHAHDFGRKAPLYAKFGARELWIIDAIKRVTVVHQGPGSDGSWRETIRYGKAEAISPLAFGGFAFRLADYLPDEEEPA